MKLVSCVVVTSWNWSSSHWRPGDENEGQKLWRKNEGRWVYETYAGYNVIIRKKKKEPFLSFLFLERERGWLGKTRRSEFIGRDGRLVFNLLINSRKRWSSWKLGSFLIFCTLWEEIVCTNWATVARLWFRVCGVSYALPNVYIDLFFINFCRLQFSLLSSRFGWLAHYLWLQPQPPSTIGSNPWIWFDLIVCIQMHGFILCLACRL